MNVLVLTPMVPSDTAPSAGAIVMHDEVCAVAAHHDVTLATLATPDDADAIRSLEHAGIRVQAVRRRSTDRVGGMLQRARLGLRWRLGELPLRTLIFQEPAMQRMLDGLAGSRFDVVHVLDNAMAAYRRPEAAAAVLTEYEVRIDADDGVVDGAAAASEATRETERRRWLAYQSTVWPQFDRVQVFTPRDAAAIRRLAPSTADRIAVNPFGVEVPAVVDRDHDDGRSIVFVGGFRHPPNVDAACWLAGDILPRVWRAHPDARLTIVGADPPPLIQRLASDRVMVTGHVPAVEPFLESAAVVAAPVRTGGGMRRKVLHAMAMGRPVVTTTRGADGIWNPPTAPTLRVADDAEGIAHHIAALLASLDDRRTLGASARAAVVAHHQRSQFADRLAALYESLRRPECAA